MLHTDKREKNKKITPHIADVMLRMVPITELIPKTCASI